VIKQQDAPELVEGAPPPEKHSYGTILRSSALIGLSTLINLTIGILRTKAMAVWLGPAGFGLMGLYARLPISRRRLPVSASTQAGCGRSPRPSAKATQNGSRARSSCCRRTAVLLGVLGAAILMAFSRQVSTLTFGTDQHATAVELLSATVLFSCLSGGQAALLQGMRRISDLVKMGVLGAASGAVISIPIVYTFRENGIVPSLICGAAVLLIVSWWYSRKITIRTPSMTAAQIGHDAAALLKLGFAFMASGLLMTGASYVTRVFVLRELGFEAAGLYQSAWTLGENVCRDHSRRDGDRFLSAPDRRGQRQQRVQSPG